MDWIWGDALHTFDHFLNWFQNQVLDRLIKEERARSQHKQNYTSLNNAQDSWELSKLSHIMHSDRGDISWRDEVSYLFFWWTQFVYISTLFEEEVSGDDL